VLVFWQQGVASAEARGWVAHTYDVRAHIRLLLGSLKDAELGQRGYLFTGNEEYLEPYEDALRDSRSATVENTSPDLRRSTMQELALLRKMTSDNPVQQNNLDEMDVLAGKLLEHLATTIKARQSQDAKA